MASYNEKFHPLKTTQQHTELRFGQCTAVSSSFQHSFLNLKFKGRNTTSWLLKKTRKLIPSMTATGAFSPALTRDDGLNTSSCPTYIPSLDLSEDCWGERPSLGPSSLRRALERSQHLVDRDALGLSKTSSCYKLYLSRCEKKDNFLCCYNEISQQVQCCFPNFKRLTSNMVCGDTAAYKASSVWQSHALWSQMAPCN